jgi:hypothetical protein
MVCYAALVLWYQRKLVAFLPFGESCTCESVPVTSNSMGSQYPVTHVVLKSRPIKCLSLVKFPTFTYTVNFYFSLLIFTSLSLMKSHVISLHATCVLFLIVAELPLLFLPFLLFLLPYKTYTYNINGELQDPCDMCVKLH